MNPIKYPKTPHLPFSPGVNPDDDVLPSYENMIGNDIIITEKLDGGNFQYFNGEIYARTVQKPATHSSFSVIKQFFSGMQGLIPSRFAVYGENMQAIHSIEYSDLKSYFYIFAVFDHKYKRWLSWRDVVKCSEMWGIPHVPILFSGTMKNELELQQWIQKKMTEGSTVGGEIEGFVIRSISSFSLEEFGNYVCKYVRKGHVQTDSDWGRKWKQCQVKE